MSTNTPARILLVEDEEDLRNLYIELLTNQGYQVTAAADGQTALNHLVQGGFDLALLDIMLPQLDGFEILEKLKQTKEPAKQAFSTIILLTNLSQDQTIARGTEYGISGYMIKSDYNPQQFLDQVKEFLDMMTN